MAENETTARLKLEIDGSQAISQLRQVQQEATKLYSGMLSGAQKTNNELSKYQRATQAVPGASAGTMAAAGLYTPALAQSRMQSQTGVLQAQKQQADQTVKVVRDAEKKITAAQREESKQRIKLMEVEANAAKRLADTRAKQKAEAANRLTIREQGNLVRVRADEQLRKWGGTKSELLAQEGSQKLAAIEERANQERINGAVAAGRAYRREENRRETLELKADLQQRNMEFRTALTARNRLIAQFNKTMPSASGMLQLGINRSIASSNINRALGLQMMNGLPAGQTASQTWQQQMNAATANFNANAANTMNPKYNYTPASAMRMPGGGGGRPPHMWQQIAGAFGFGPGGGGMGSVARNVMGGLGIGAGMYAVTGATRSVVASTETATAYERQTVAARNLAGSQQRLNQLLEAYEEASGGAVDKVTALSNVTRLQATGFADTAAEVQKFVRATRGASIALGKPQEYVIQETQLAVSNTSFKRLDQIGLGISEVQDRMKELRGENKELTRETAFQMAVMGLLDEKFGGLTKTVEGQATGVEKLKKTWSDLGLEMGQLAKGPVDLLAENLSTVLGFAVGTYIQSEIQKIDLAIRTLQALGVNSLSGIPLRTSEQQLVKIANDERDAGRHPGRARVRDTGYNEEQQQVMVDYMQAGVALEKKYGQQRTDAVEQYESQRLNTVRNYEQQIARASYDSLLSRVREAQDFGRQRARQEEDLAQQQNREAEDFGKQRARSEADFYQQRARAEQDFYIQRARAGQDYMLALAKSNAAFQRQGAKAQEGLERTIFEAQRDYDEREIERREEHQENLAEMQDDYEKERERAAEDHQETMRQAAGNLDAIAVAEEQRRYKRELRDAQEAHQEQIDDANEAEEEQRDDAKKQLDRRISDAREAYERERQEAEENHRLQSEEAAEAFRLAREREDEDRALRESREIEDRGKQLAREDNDRATRIAREEEDMQKRIERENEDRQLRIDREIEDRGLQLQRQRDDHEDQLEELDNQHDKRIIQIEEQQQEERKELDEQHKKNLAALKIRVAGFEDEMEKVTEAAMRNTDAFLKRIEIQTRALANGETLESAYGSHSSGADPYIDRGLPVVGDQRGAIGRANNSFIFNINGDGLDSGEVASLVEDKVYDLLVELGHMN